MYAVDQVLRNKYEEDIPEAPADIEQPTYGYYCIIRVLLVRIVLL